MTAPHVGRELFEGGWRQGSLLNAASAQVAWLRLRSDTGSAARAVGPTTGAPAAGPWAVTTEPFAADDQLVVVTQTCDLCQPPDREPYVEVVRAYWTRDKGIIHDASWNSVRRFLIQRRVADDGTEEGLIADATTRVQFEKAALLAVTP